MALYVNLQTCLDRQHRCGEPQAQVHHPINPSVEHPLAKQGLQELVRDWEVLQEEQIFSRHMEERQCEKWKHEELDLHLRRTEDGAVDSREKHLEML